MDKKLKITVMAADIRAATRFMNKYAERAEYCPIALATKRALRQRGAKERGNIRETSAELNGFTFDLPKVAAMFIHSFDRNKTVTPFTFKLWEKSTHRA